MFSLLDSELPSQLLVQQLKIKRGPSSGGGPLEPNPVLKFFPWHKVTSTSSSSSALIESKTQREGETARLCINSEKNECLIWSLNGGIIKKWPALELPFPPPLVPGAGGAFL